MSTASFLIQYQNFVLSKEAPPPSLTATQVRLVHGALGLATETLELSQSHDRTNTIEELEDILWYLMLNASVLEINLHNLELELPFDPKQNSLPYNDLEAKVEEYLSLCKKLLIYGQEVHLQVGEAFKELWKAFLIHISACNISLPILIEGNTAKLSKRYASSFSQEESALRKDKQA